jgi:putative exosortase-associated protein (TIGR04073 family)
MASAEEYTAARKFVRGLAGITTGFLEIPGNIVEESRNSNVGAGLTLGLAKGLGMFVARTLSGTYEVLTAPFAVPAGFEPVIAPEFAWQYFEGGERGDYYARQAAELREINGVIVERRGNTLALRFSDELLFASGSAAISRDARTRLAAVAKVLKDYPNSTVVVAGHADSTGDESHNLRLSTARANAVQAELAGRGVDPARMVATGYGAARPVASNATASGRQLNRRIEIELQPAVAAPPMASGLY